MSEFKIGDVVKVTGNNSGGLRHYYDIGTEGKITSERDEKGQHDVANLDRDANPSWQIVNENDLERVLFEHGVRVRITGNGEWEDDERHTYHWLDIGTVAEVVSGPDSDNDYFVRPEDGSSGQYVNAGDLEQVGDEDEQEDERPEPVPVSEDRPCQVFSGTCTICPRPEPEQDQPFKIGDRVRVIGDPGNNPVWVGDTGTVTDVNVSLTPGTRYIVTVKWDKGDTFGLFNFRLEKIEDAAETEPGQPTVKEGDLVRVIHAAGYTENGYVDEGTLARIIDVPTYGLNRPYAERVGSTRWPETFFIDKWETVEVPEGDNDDSPVGEVPALDLSNLIISGPLSYTTGGIVSADEPVDVVNHPPHYKFSNGAEVIDITEHLSFNGGNAVKYLARSTRGDGNNKGNVLEDLRKAAWYVAREIERVENDG